MDGTNEKIEIIQIIPAHPDCWIEYWDCDEDGTIEKFYAKPVCLALIKDHYGTCIEPIEDDGTPARLIRNYHGMVISNTDPRSAGAEL